MNIQELRLLVAGKCLEGLLANPETSKQLRPEEYAPQALEHADRLISLWEKTGGGAPVAVTPGRDEMLRSLSLEWEKEEALPS